MSVSVWCCVSGSVSVETRPLACDNSSGVYIPRYNDVTIFFREMNVLLRLNYVTWQHPGTRMYIFSIKLMRTFHVSLYSLSTMHPRSQSGARSKYFIHLTFMLAIYAHILFSPFAPETQSLPSSSVPVPSSSSPLSSSSSSLSPSLSLSNPGIPFQTL